tara:strand:+ start:4296 stop:4475 length:180 start_codon:yes stop_codon:yes gene_type:complete
MADPGDSKVIEALIVDALVSAAPHVYRQQHHGKHEQDRKDAEEWISAYGEIIKVLKGHG